MALNILKEMTTFLASKGLGVVGGSTPTLFEGELPATPAVCGGVRHGGGLGPDRGFGVDGIAYETPGVEIVFRGAPHDYSGPWLKAQKAYQEVVKVQPETVLVAGGSVYHQIAPLQPPFKIFEDGLQRNEIGFVCLCFKEPVTL